MIRQSHVEILSNREVASLQYFEYRYFFSFTESIGSVAKRYSESDQEIFAIKTFDNHLFDFGSFVHEIDAMVKQFSHPGIVEIINYVRANQNFPESAIVMEYVRNGSLSDHIELCRAGRGELSDERQLKIAIGVALSMRLVHRNLKPFSILLTFDFEPKICDFGQAKVFDRASRGHTVLVGTKRYSSPEVTSGHHTNTVDVFSSGMILY